MHMEESLACICRGMVHWKLNKKIIFSLSLSLSLGAMSGRLHGVFEPPPPQLSKSTETGALSTPPHFVVSAAESYYCFASLLYPLYILLVMALSYSSELRPGSGLFRAYTEKTTCKYLKRAIFCRLFPKHSPPVPSLLFS